MQRLQSSEQQSRDGGFGFAEFLRDFHQAESLQVMQHDRFTLEFGELRDDFGQSQQVLLLDGPLAGRRLHGGQPRVGAREREVLISRAKERVRKGS